MRIFAYVLVCVVGFVAAILAALWSVASCTKVGEIWAGFQAAYWFISSLAETLIFLHSIWQWDRDRFGDAVFMFASFPPRYSLAPSGEDPSSLAMAKHRYRQSVVLSFVLLAFIPVGWSAICVASGLARIFGGA